MTRGYGSLPAVSSQLPATGPYGASAVGAQEPFELGRRIGKYRLVYPVGEGGMSVVYLAEDEALDRKVALKVLHRHLARDPEARARFTREARAVARLTHRNIPEIYDFSESANATDGPSYIVTEYVDGAPLARIFADARARPAAESLMPELGVLFTLGVAHALAHAHQQNIVHRDVKPENVLVGKDGVVKLTDFGIAQIRGLESMTMTGTLIGSPAHMAPEQIEIAKDVDARADVWGLGTVLYMGITGGKLPFEADNPHRLLKKIVDGHFTDPRRLSPHVDARLAAIVQGCLAVDRERRYQSVQAVITDLEGWLRPRGLGGAEGGPAGAPPGGGAELELRRFMADPEGANRLLMGRLAQTLMTLGDEAIARRDRPAALELFGRVLVLDPDRDDALERVRRLERQLRARRGARWALYGVAGAGLATAGTWLAIGALDAPAPPPPIPVAARALARAQLPSEGPTMRPLAAPQAEPAGLGNAGSVFGAALGDDLARITGVADKNASEQAKEADLRREREEREREAERRRHVPVPVRLTVYPPAVRIAVDGRTLAPGAETTLLPGSYVVTLTHTGCPECAPDRRSLVVPMPGVDGVVPRVEQHYVFERGAESLEPATLLVRCSDGAYVTDPNGRRYDCNVVHAVPVSSARAVMVVLTAHAPDGSLRHQQFKLAPKSAIEWTL